MRLLPAIFLSLLACSQVLAAATPWQDVAPGARLRLISSDVEGPDGVTLVGLELDMPQSSKTYWRLPGESGIPTGFDVSGSSGLSAPAILWPYPVAEESDGLLDYVYHGPTVLPVKLKADGTSPLLKAAVTMGVCAEVCVPVRASFTLPVSFGTADAAQSIRLQQAAALAPIAWNGSGPPFGGVSYDAASRVLRVDLAAAPVEPASVIVSTEDPSVIFAAPQKSPDGQALLLSLRGQARSAAWLNTPVDLTFLTSMGSFEVSERVTVSR